MRWLLLPCVVATTAVLGGCAIDHGPGGGSKPATAEPTSCTIYDRNGDAEVTFEANGDVESACQGTIENFGKGGEYWSEADTSTATTTVCVMSNGDETVTVRDAGGAYVGGEICAHLAGEGYTDVTGD